MKFIGYHSNKAKKDKIHLLNSFLCGAKKIGYGSESYYISKKKKQAPLLLGDCYVCIGIRILKYIKSIFKVDISPRIVIYDPIIRGNVFKRNYFNDDEYAAISRNYIHDSSYFYNVSNERWNKLKDAYNVEVKPWRKKGDDIIFAYVTNAYINPSYNEDDICKVMRKNIKKCISTGRKVIVCSRPHKKNDVTKMNFNTMVKNCSGLSCDFSIGINSNLDNAYCLISYGGGSSTEWSILGIPSISIYNSFSDSLYPHKNLDKFLKNPPTPDRENWFNWLGYQQWTVSEMKEGLPVKHYMRDMKKSKGEHENSGLS